eukprot:6208489-Pleurochrysis_carterae.AAC.2
MAWPILSKVLRQDTKQGRFTQDFSREDQLPEIHVRFHGRYSCIGCFGGGGPFPFLCTPHPRSSWPPTHRLSLPFLVTSPSFLIDSLSLSLRSQQGHLQVGAPVPAHAALVVQAEPCRGDRQRVQARQEGPDALADRRQPPRLARRRTGASARSIGGRGRDAVRRVE